MHKIGVISKNELSAIIREFNQAIPEDQLEAQVTKFFNEANLDGGDAIDFGEFLAVLYRARTSDSKSEFSKLIDRVQSKG